MTNPLRKKQYLLFIIVLFSFACKMHKDRYDSFDTEKVSEIWSEKKLAPHALEIQSTIVRSGKSAAKITLHTGDNYEAGNDSSHASERDELLEAGKDLSVEDKKYAYSFSLFIPSDFPIVDTRLVIAQWKQKCEKGTCEDRSPVIAIRYESGKLFITSQTREKKQILYETTEDVRNKWLDFKFIILFTRSISGRIFASLNGKELFKYKGPTAYSEQFGFPDNSLFYFKMGLYRDVMPEPMTIYIDEYRKERLSDGE
jgi:hypothetical protein